MTGNIQKLVQEATATILAGEEFNFDEAAKQLTDAEIKTLASEAVCSRVNHLAGLLLSGDAAA